MFEMKDWFGQDIAWQGAMVAAGKTELFVRGQTGSALDGSDMAGTGRRPQDAAAQADLALSNLATLLREAGSSMDEVCKITVYISDRAYRSAVYPVIGRHFRGIHPVSTGLIVAGFARPEILFEIDAWVLRPQGGPHQRLRRYHSNAVRYGFGQQALDCDFCMAVGAGSQVILRGQTDRAFLPGVTDAVLRRLHGVTPCFGALVVKGLASPELLMEVDVTAVRPAGA
jgi:enamine deaminase RidA (YjgF/YER057c/UK114 family)